MQKSSTLKRLFEIGGLIAGVVLIGFGVTAIVMGFQGRSTVASNLKAEQIYFGDAATDPTVPKQYSNQLVDTGTKAHAFATMIHGHALEASNGLVYAKMGRFMAKPGTPANFTDGNGGTSIDKYAATDANGPIANGARNTWITATSLSTALNVSYMAQQMALFGIVVGFALLLSGIGFVVLSLGGAIRGLAWHAKSEAPAAKSAIGKAAAA